MDSNRTAASGQRPGEPATAEAPSATAGGLLPETAMDPALRRVMAYLRLAPLTEARKLHTAEEVLERLEAEGLGGEAAVSRALELLHHYLPPAEAFPACLPVLRRHMTPEEMDRRPWIAWLDRHTLWPRLASTLLFNTRWEQVLQALALTLFCLADGRIDPRFDLFL